MSPAETVVSRFQPVPGVFVDLRAITSNVVVIDFISRSTAPKGSGAQAIKQLLALAASEHVSVHLEIVKGARVTESKLSRYYKKLGFKRWGAGRDYVAFRWTPPET